ncbi:MAG: hypothetical protein U1B84_01345, partial [Variovorax sp.]|nr:hypothetical protein [Variovorax sp.]
SSFRCAWILIALQAIQHGKKAILNPCLTAREVPVQGGGRRPEDIRGGKYPVACAHALNIVDRTEPPPETIRPGGKQFT